MSEITIDQVHPKLRPLVKDFLLKCKYPFKLQGSGRYLRVTEDGSIGEDDVRYHETINFFDPNAETMGHAGAIRWKQNDFNGPYKYRIVTRNVIHQKYTDSERRRSVETLVETRVLKEMLKYIKPFTIHDIAREHDSTSRTLIESWKSEHYRDARDSFRGIPDSSFVRELHNLKAQGVTFVTEEFNRMANVALDAYAETERRQKTIFHQYFVRFAKDGRVVVRKFDGEVTEYNAFEQLPDFIQETIGMLRIMNEDTPRLIGIGARCSENLYWVIQRDEQKA
jgi:transposase-like protein